MIILICIIIIQTLEKHFGCIQHFDVGRMVHLKIEFTINRIG